ncbi:MAG: Vgb family protein [Ktedonobacteraceae bacterium]
MLNVRKITLSLLALFMLMGSAILAMTMTGYGLHITYASQLYSVSARDFYIPSGSDPWGTTFDSSGHVWLAIPGCDPSPTCGSNTPPGKIAEFNPSSSSWMNTYQLPSGYAQPLFLAFDSQGRLWFPLPMANSLAMFNPGNNTYQKWAIPTGNAGPWGVAVDHNGKVWFTEHFTNKIGRFDPVTQKFMEVSTPASNSQPYGIVVDASNNVWFTENNSSVALIGEYTSGGKLQEFKIRTGSTSGLTPHLISVDTNGNIWWTEGWVGMIAELKVAQAAPGTNKGVTEYIYKRNCSNCSTHTSGISVDSNGLIWFDDAEQGIFGTFPDSGSGSFATYNAPTSNGHPHDGLHVDGQNRIWFDEEFANKLAEANQSGVPVPTPTSTQGVQPSPTSTGIASPTPTATSSPGATLAQDTFQRASQTYWGTASDSQTWGGDANNSNVFSISGNTGKVSNGNTSYSAVLGPVATNAQVLFSGSISNLNNVNFGAVLRWKDSNNWYKAYIDGSNLVVQKKINSNTTILGQTTFTAKAGTSYTMRFSVSGSTLTAKVWQTGNSEPTNWMVNVTDSSLQSGYCGLRMLDQNGAVVTFTNFTCTSQ